MPSTPDPPTRAALAGVVEPHGPTLRGGFMPDAADALPPLPGDRTAAVVWLVGQIGSSGWRAFAASAPARDGQPDPMDRWARSIAEPIAQRWRGVALFPSDGPPYRPFQRWAERAEGLRRSPLGLAIHPAAGLWHAYRFALALPILDAGDAAELVRAAAQPAVDPCSRCEGRPCLSACPVKAFTASGYDVGACTAHLRSPQGADCMALGCRARRACPVGSDQRYAPEQAAFHMRAFLRGESRARGDPAAAAGTMSTRIIRAPS